MMYGGGGRTNDPDNIVHDRNVCGIPFLCSDPLYPFISCTAPFPALLSVHIHVRFYDKSNCNGLDPRQASQLSPRPLSINFTIYVSRLYYICAAVTLDKSLLM